MMAGEHTLVSWVGGTDLRAPDTEDPGPIARALASGQFAAVELLCDRRAAPAALEQEAKRYVDWLRSRYPDIRVTARPVLLSRGPMDFEQIFRAARDAVTEIKSSQPGIPRLAYHLSPGTSAMATAFILLANGEHEARLVRTYERADGIEDVDIPFDIVVELASRDVERRIRSAATRPSAAVLRSIEVRDPAMVRAVTEAERAAPLMDPALIMGETGTGKEVIAELVGAKRKPFKVLNCAAIPEALVESELFGHTRGAFTGASAARIGLFQAADQGTLFLDEVGELPLAAQATLLRAIDAGKVRRVGATDEEDARPRIVAATHRDLAGEVAQGRFRQDLLYRLAVVVIKVPPLRERSLRDFGVLCRALWSQVVSEARISGAPELPAAVIGRLRAHSWPGNVRELKSTLARLAHGGVLDAACVDDALLVIPGQGDDILERPLPVDLRALLDEVAAHYLERAKGRARGKAAATLLGLPKSVYSTWCRNHGIR